MKSLWDASLCNNPKLQQTNKKLLWNAFLLWEHSPSSAVSKLYRINEKQCIQQLGTTRHWSHYQRRVMDSGISQLIPICTQPQYMNMVEVSKLDFSGNYWPWLLLKPSGNILSPPDTISYTCLSYIYFASTFWFPTLWLFKQNLNCSLWLLNVAFVVDNSNARTSAFPKRVWCGASPCSQWPMLSLVSKKNKTKYASGLLLGDQTQLCQLQGKKTKKQKTRNGL